MKAETQLFSVSHVSTRLERIAKVAESKGFKKLPGKRDVRRDGDGKDRIGHVFDPISQ